MGVGIAGGLCWLLAMSAYDIAERRLPNWLTLPGAVLVLAVACAAGRGGQALAAAMGGGDVKLAVGLGAMTGAFGVDVWLLAALAAPLLTAVLALGVAARGNRTVPHGPSMCLASAAAVALVVV